MKPYLEPRSLAFTSRFRDDRNWSMGKFIHARRRLKKHLKTRARQFAKLAIKTELNHLLTQSNEF